MAPFSLLPVIITALAMAGLGHGIRASFLPLSSDSVNTLNVNAVVNSFHVPEFNSSSITHKRITSRSSGPSRMSRRWTVTEEECLDPSDRPYYEDCANICSAGTDGVPEGWLVDYQGPIEIQPLELCYVEDGDCAFGIANLDPCEIIDIDPLADVWGYCYSMYLNCAANGYDGFLAGTDPEMAMALSGSPSAPPYVEGPCQA